MVKGEGMNSYSLAGLKGVSIKPPCLRPVRHTVNSAQGLLQVFVEAEEEAVISD
jgi:hypothetical protein